MNKCIPSHNTSGVMGVYWVKRLSRWEARISIDNKEIPLGTHAHKSDAIAARKAAEVKYGFHPNHGRD